MNILDENLPATQRQLLHGWGIPVRHLGYGLGRKGIKDDEIIPFLLTISRPTFFSLDWGVYKRNLRHSRYCLVFLEINRDESAIFIRRFLRHTLFNTQAKRLGNVIRIAYAGLYVWQLNGQEEITIAWE